MREWTQGSSLVRHAVVSLSLVAGSFSLACSDDGGAPPPATCLFSGVAVTDTTGQIISDDTSDWCPYPRYGIGWAWSLYPAVPNPARIGTTIEFGCLSNGAVVIDIKDCGLNTVRTFHPDSGVYTVRWDLRDAQGRRVDPGLYRCFYEVAYPNTLYTCNGDIQVLAP